MQHHPWRVMRDEYPDWRIEFTDRLAPGELGRADCELRIIWLAKGLTQAQRRSTLTHEAMHAARGDLACDSRDEAFVEQAAARLLLPLDRLLDVIPWAHNVAEAADDLWVDVAMLRCRLEHLHRSEHGAIRRAIANRDNEDET